MLKYQIITNNKDFVTYRYFPDGQEQYGEITVKKATKQITKQKIAPNDEFKLYFFKMFKRIREFIDKEDYKESGIIAWY